MLPASGGVALCACLLLPLVVPVDVHLGGHGVQAVSHRTFNGRLTVDGREFPPQGFHYSRTPAFTVHPDGGAAEHFPARSEWSWRVRKWYYWITVW